MSIEKLSEIADEIAASKAKLAAFAKDEGKSAIGAAFAKCFEPPTNLKSISWTQYTPYFNDGEACTFGVNDPELIAEIDGNEEEFSLYDLKREPGSQWYNGAREKLGNQACASFQETWGKLNDEIMLAVFGDHVKVTITKDEVSVEEYIHD